MDGWEIAKRHLPETLDLTNHNWRDDSRGLDDVPWALSRASLCVQKSAPPTAAPCIAGRNLTVKVHP